MSTDSSPSSPIEPWGPPQGPQSGRIPYESTSFIGQARGYRKGTKPGAEAGESRGCGVSGEAWGAGQEGRSSQRVVWWTCSREEMTLPSWTSSTMVRTWRVVTAAGDRHSEVSGGRETLAQPPAPRVELALPTTAICCPCLCSLLSITSRQVSLLPLPLPVLVPQYKSSLPDGRFDPDPQCPSARRGATRWGLSPILCSLRGMDYAPVSLITRLGSPRQDPGLHHPH